VCLIIYSSPHLSLLHVCTYTYKILYNLFDWPTRPHSQLVVVGIANTMDLPDRLGDKIKSRATHEPINFKSYSRGQVETIIKSRLKEFVNVFEESAITIAAAKVSAYSGDIRLALQICSRAADLRRSKMLLNKEQSSMAEMMSRASGGSSTSSSTSAGSSLVSKADVLEVIKQLNESTHVEALHTLSPCQVFVLVALGAEIRFEEEKTFFFFFKSKKYLF
jgi:origin recognition complex subunit 1